MAAETLEEIDALFLRAFWMRGDRAALENIDKILELHPNHSEARRERSLYPNINMQTIQPVVHQSVDIRQHTHKIYTKTENRLEISDQSVRRIVAGVLVSVLTVAGLAFLQQCFRRL